MKCPSEMGSGVMMYIPSFIKMGSSILKVMGEGFTDTQTAGRSHKPTFISFRIVNLREMSSLMIW
jgi:hypothetical protein